TPAASGTLSKIGLRYWSKASARNDRTPANRTRMAIGIEWRRMRLTSSQRTWINATPVSVPYPRGRGHPRDAAFTRPAGDPSAPVGEPGLMGRAQPQDDADDWRARFTL